MKKFSLCAGFAALAMTFAAAQGVLAATAAGTGALAAPAGGTQILVFNRMLVIRDSKLGGTIHDQLRAYSQKAQSELGPEQDALQKEEQANGDKKNPALEQKAAAFQKKLRERQELIQGGEMAARKVYMAQEGAILNDLMAEHHAVAVVQKTAVEATAKGVILTDVTKDVIARLDKKMTTYKVPLVKASLSDQLQMMGQQRPQ